MSYARWGSESDVYVYAHYLGYVQCCGCLLGESDPDNVWNKSVNLGSREEVVAHMMEHVEVGHTIPTDLLDPYTYDLEDFTPYER